MNTTIVQAIYLILVVINIIVGVSAGVAWLRLRQRSELKYFSNLSLGTSLAHAAAAIAYTLVLVITAFPTTFAFQIGVLVVVLIIPSEMAKVVLWAALALYLAGLLNGIHVPLEATDRALKGG